MALQKKPYRQRAYQMLGQSQSSVKTIVYVGKDKTIIKSLNQAPQGSDSLSKEYIKLHIACRFRLFISATKYDAYANANTIPGLGELKEGSFAISEESLHSDIIIYSNKEWEANATVACFYSVDRIIFNLPREKK